MAIRLASPPQTPPSRACLKSHGRAQLFTSTSDDTTNIQHFSQSLSLSITSTNFTSHSGRTMPSAVRQRSPSPASRGASPKRARKEPAATAASGLSLPSGSDLDAHRTAYRSAVPYTYAAVSGLISDEIVRITYHRRSHGRLEPRGRADEPARGGRGGEPDLWRSWRGRQSTGMGMGAKGDGHLQGGSGPSSRLRSILHVLFRVRKRASE
jgi:hypothetical protein